MPASTTTRFGTLFRKFRKRAGLNQQQLADYLRVSPKRVSKWEIGVSNPPGDPTFYESLRNVPGITESDITLLRKAAEAEKSTEVVRTRHAVIEGDEMVLDDSVLTALADFAQKLAEAIEKSLKIQATEAKFGKPGTAGIEVRKEGILRRENPEDRKRFEAKKANRDRVVLTADHLKILGGFAAKGQEFVLDMVEHLTEDTAALSEELQPIGQLLTETCTKIITCSCAETLTMLSAIGLEEIARGTEQAIEASPSTVEEAPEILTESSYEDDLIRLWSSEKGANPVQILVKPEGDPLPHVEKELQPSSQPEQGGQQAPKKGVVYEVVATLRQAAQKTGVPLDEIVTTRDIEAEYNINKKLVHEYTRRGLKGQPHLTPLPVRVKGSGIGGGQLLFRREDIERIMANPPKPGRPPK